MLKKRIWDVCCALFYRTVCCGFIVCVLGLDVHAQERVLSLPDLTAEPGDEIQVPITIDDAEGLIGFRVVLDIPNQTEIYPLEYVPGSSSVNGTIARGWRTMENDASQSDDPNNEFAGSILINGSGIQPLSGSGTLLRFRLRVKENIPNQLVPLNFKLTGRKISRLNDGAVPVRVEHGSVLITGSSVPTYTPSPTGTIFPDTPTQTPSSTPSLTPSNTPTFTPTITPTITPTPTSSGQEEIIIVTDDLTTTEDLSGGTDYDAPGDRALVIRADWTLAGIDVENIRDMHVYVKVDGTLPWLYLGRTASGDDSILEWRDNNPHIFALFRDGPQFGKTYQFRVYAIKKHGFPIFYGPYENAAPVSYELDESQTTPTPTPGAATVIVTDTEASTIDISNGQDHDPPSERKLVIRWDLTQLGIDESELHDIHVYVRTDQSGDYQYLGRTSNANFEQLVWETRGAHIVGQFRAGPDFGHSYEFKVFMIRKQGNPRVYGPYENAGPVEYLPMITVTDTVDTVEDLSNGFDIDPITDRDLVIRWTFDPYDLDVNNIQDFHVYVRVNQQMPYRYLGHTGDGTAEYLEWTANSSLISGAFRAGPLFGNRYEFKVFPIKISGRPRVYGPYDNIGPVLFMPVVTVTDDVESTEDLSNGEDRDSPDDVELVIRWNMDSAGIDVADVNQYHIYMYVNDAKQPVFLGRVQSANLHYMVWNEGSQNVVPTYRDGPQIGNSYQFRIYILTKSGRPRFVYHENAGPVEVLAE